MDSRVHAPLFVYCRLTDSDINQWFVHSCRLSCVPTAGNRVSFSTPKQSLLWGSDPTLVQEPLGWVVQRWRCLIVQVVQLFILAKTNVYTNAFKSNVFTYFFILPLNVNPNKTWRCPHSAEPHTFIWNFLIKKGALSLSNNIHIE